MIKCALCIDEFVSNLGGQLTNHINSVHALSLEDYVVQTAFGGVEPRCACGLCDERPAFRRGRFESYAHGHNRFDERNRRWREKHGEPCCEICHVPTGFRRAEPIMRCKNCNMVGKGFDNPAVQEKIKAIVVERYGVTNVSRVSAVREKISTALVGRCGRVDSDETCRKKSNASKAMWAKPGQRSKIAMAIGDATRRPEIRAQRSAQMAHQMSNPAFRERAFANHKNRLTKLHVRLREQLGLEALGFVSEQRIGRYFVDELHRGSRVVVEVFGDHPHANPKRFGPNDVVRMPGQSYAASKKWALDAARIKMIESMGYRVIVCWESDDIEHVKREIVNVVRSDPT